MGEKEGIGVLRFALLDIPGLQTLVNGTVALPKEHLLPGMAGGIHGQVPVRGHVNRVGVCKGFHH